MAPTRDDYHPDDDGPPNPFRMIAENIYDELEELFHEREGGGAGDGTPYLNR